MRTLATLHIADLFRDPKMALPTKGDFAKIPRYLVGTWPRPIPEIETSVYQLDWEPGFAFDTEYTRDTKFLIRFSIATPSGRVFVIEAGQFFARRDHILTELSKATSPYTLPEMRRSEDAQFAARVVSEVLSRGRYDEGARQDTGTEAGSAPLYGVPPSFEAVRLDARTVSAAVERAARALRDLRATERALASGPRSRDGSSAGVTVLSLQSGAWVDGGQHPDYLAGRVLPLHVVFQNAVVDLPHLARILPEGILIAPDDTLLLHSCLWSEWPHDLGFLASLYSVHEKMKHLSEENPILYAGGDAIDTLAAFRALLTELRADPQSERIYRTQSLPLLPVLLKAKKQGIRINRRRVESAAIELAAQKAGARYLAYAHVGWPIKLGSVGGTGQVAQYLYGDVGMAPQFKKGAKNRREKKITVDADAIASLRAQITPIPDFEQEERDGLVLSVALDRVLVGADPILEARVVYAAALQSMSHYIEPALDALTRDGRFYPDFLIHAQANARWSTNDPPLAQLPEDLRDIVYPDEHTTWLGHDWDQIELRVNAVSCNDVPTLEAFALGHDIHTLNMCDCFGYPYPPNRVKPWDQPENAAWIAALNFQGKEDARRVYAKRFVYRLDYGGDPENAGDIPGTALLGLTKRTLVIASQRYLAAHPAKAQARMEIAHLARTTGVVRSFDGRRRRLLGDGNARIRAAFDFPMQAGVSGWFNETIILVTKELPWLDWMYGMHDSQWWQCADERVAETWPVYKKIVERPVVIGGRSTVFPASFKQQCVAHKDCLKHERRLAA